MLFQDEILRKGRIFEEEKKELNKKIEEQSIALLANEEEITSLKYVPDPLFVSSFSPPDTCLVSCVFNEYITDSLFILYSTAYLFSLAQLSGLLYIFPCSPLCLSLI